MTAAAIPTDFPLEQTLAKPSIRRLRKLMTKATGVDPIPSPEIIESFTAGMWEGDPVAEAFVDEVFFGADGPRKGRQLLDQALDHGLDSIENPPPSMVRLFNEFEQLPAWVDPAQVELGAKIWRRWGTDLFNIAGAETLEFYTESAVAVPLSLTGGYAGDKALHRFMETVRFWIDTSEPGALLRLGSAGRATAMRVRVMHVSVRRRVSSHPEWHADRWGLPISQSYMMMTLMGGSTAPAAFAAMLGYHTTPSELRALLHYQRFLGHLLGVHPRWYPADIKESMQILFLAGMARSFTSGEHGKELIESFPTAFEPKSGSLKERYAYHLVVGYMALMMSPLTRRRYDVPNAFPSVLLPIARFPYITVRELARRALPQLDATLDQRGRKAREAWYAQQMQGKQAAFDASGDLRR